MALNKGAQLSVELRPVVESDLDQVIAIERQSFVSEARTAEGWKRRDFLRYECTVAVQAGQVFGFLVAREVVAATLTDPGEREILNLAIEASHRRQSLASLLLQQEIETGAHLFLEVRESNHPAQALYTSAGFSTIGRRPKYYRHPEEAAILMARSAVSPTAAAAVQCP